MEEDTMLLNIITNDGVQSAARQTMERKQYDKGKERQHKRNVSRDGHTASSNESVETFQVISSLFRKNPEIPRLSSGITESCRNDVTFSSSDFKNLHLAPHMISNLESTLEVTTMTSVQKAALPSLIIGKDVFIKSPTGTGKTLTYVIPVVQSLQRITPKIQRTDGPYCVVLVPTRELAAQSLAIIHKVLKPFIWIVPGCVTGGEKRKSEKARLRKGLNIVVATPGRLVDHLRTTQCLQMNKLQWLIIDEADRLLDMGFEKDITCILSAIKSQATKRIQTVLLSATSSKDVENLKDLSLNEAVTINMTSSEDCCHRDDNEYETPSQLEQFCVVVPMKLRLVTLAAFLKRSCEDNSKIIVFFTTQDSVDFHYQLFSTVLQPQKGRLTMVKLHGKLAQQERKKVFQEFRKMDAGILLTTDVAARGLDLPSVNWIVQYNAPVSVADYVHRVGRTARIGCSGNAILFLLPTEIGFLDILNDRKLRLQEMKMDDILNALVANSSTKSRKIINPGQFQAEVTTFHILFEEALLDRRNKELKQRAKTAFNSFIGAYSTYPASMKPIFHPKNLHLGHLAKSFALRETPTELSQVVKARKRPLMVRERTKKQFKKQCITETGGDQLANGPRTRKYRRKTV